MKKASLFRSSTLHNNKMRWGFVFAGSLVSLLLAGIGFWLIRAALTPPGSITLTSARPDEYVVAISSFNHHGGEKYDFGEALKDDLGAMSGVPSYFRADLLPHTPDSTQISDLMQQFGVRIVVIGSYDKTAVDSWVYVAPPSVLPTQSDGDESRLVMFLDVGPQLFHVYAPRGVAHPLQYLQYWLVGQAYFWHGNYANAEAALRLAQQLMPTQIPVDRRADMDHYRAAVLWTLGYIAGPVSGDWQQAQHYFYQSQKFDSTSLPAQLGLAASLSQTGAPAKALDMLTISLRTHPDAWQLYFALAQIRMQQGKIKDALAMYDRAIGLLSSQQTAIDQQALADVYFNRGYLYYQQGDLPKALADYQQARSLGRHDSYLLSNLGWTAYLLEDYDTAVAASTEAAALAPGRPDLAFNKALLLLAAGDSQNARDAYVEAIHLTLGIDDVLTRSTYFGGAYQDLQALEQKRPDLKSVIDDLLQQIDDANG